jgi:5-methyltetrahydropteroyltriglutamate--homocysteine methyltransferase
LFKECVDVSIPTEPIGSISRPPALIEAARGFRSGRVSQAELLSRYDPATQHSIAQFEATGSNVVTDGEQAKESFATYSVHDPTNIAAVGTPIPFAHGRHALCLLATSAADPAAIPG